GEVSASTTADHLRQRAAIRGEGFPGVPSPMGDEARLNQPALSSIQREAGAVSSDLEGASDSSQDAAELGGCSASGGRVCGTLQHGTVAQRVGLRDAPGPAGGSAPGDLRGEGSETGSGARATAPAASQPGDRAVNILHLPGSESSLKLRASTRRIGLCWEATRAPWWTRIPQAWAAQVAQAGLLRDRQQSEKSQGFGDGVPESFPDQTKTRTRGKSALAFSANRRFTLNQYMLGYEDANSFFRAFHV